MPLTFIDWIFILQLLICLLVLTVFWWSLQGFLYKISWSLQIDTVLLFSGWMVLFLFLGYLLWLGLPVLCWIKVMTVFLHPVFFLFLERKLSALCHWGQPWRLRWWRVCLQCRRPSFNHWVRRPPGEGDGYPVLYSYLENSMDRGAWQATVHGVSKSWTWLSMHAYSHFHTKTN